MEKRVFLKEKLGERKLLRRVKSLNGVAHPKLIVVLCAVFFMFLVPGFLPVPVLATDPQMVTEVTSPACPSGPTCPSAVGCSSTICSTTADCPTTAYDCPTGASCPTGAQTCPTGAGCACKNVGGYVVGVNKFELLAPWIGIALAMVAITSSVVYIKRRKEKQ